VLPKFRSTDEGRGRVGDRKGPKIEHFSSFRVSSPSPARSGVRIVDSKSFVAWVISQVDEDGVISIDKSDNEVSLLLKLLGLSHVIQDLVDEEIMSFKTIQLIGEKGLQDAGVKSNTSRKRIRKYSKALSRVYELLCVSIDSSKSQAV